MVVGSSFPPFLFPFHLPFFLPGWPGWIIPSAVSPIVVSRVAVLRAAVFRTASGTAAPVLRRHYLCRPVCPARCVHGFCCPGAIPLACLFSGCRVPDARRLPVCSPGGAPLAVVFRSCRAVRFPRRRALGSGVMRCRFHRHRSLCARLFLFLRPAVLAVFLRGVLELLDAASQAAHQFGDFPAAEQEQYDQQDKYQLGRAEEQGEDEYVMVCSGLWCVRFPSGLSCRIPGDRDCLADKCTKNFRNPAFRGEKKRGAPEAPRPNCLSGICYLKNIDEISL